MSAPVEHIQSKIEKISNTLRWLIISAQEISLYVDNMDSEVKEFLHTVECDLEDVYDNLEELSKVDKDLRSWGEKQEELAEQYYNKLNYYET